MTDKKSDNNKNSNKKKQRKGKRLNATLLLSLTIAFFITTIIGIVSCILISDSLNKKNSDLETMLRESQSENAALIQINQQAYLPEKVDAMVKEAQETASAEAKNDIKSFIKSSMSTKEANTSELLRSLFPEYIVYRGSEGYVFADIDHNIPANNITKTDIVTNEDGTVSYIPNGEAKYLKGIDVSQHQGNINWEKVKEAGVDYAIIRVGIRGYGSGKLVLDEQFENNIKGAITNDIQVGVYFFSQATSEEEIREEVDFVLEAIAPYKIEYPVAIDIEKVEDSKARGNLISKEDRTNYTDIFCKEIKDAGYTPMIYGNLFSLFNMLDITKLQDYKTWFAFYDSYLYYPYQVDTWQYTESLSIPGISTKVDGNITFVE